VAAQRLRELAQIAGNSARPWYQKLGLSAGSLSKVDENWYRNY